MNDALALLVAAVAALPTTLVVLALWVGHARLVDGNSVDSVFLPLVFLFVSLIFFVSLAANLCAVIVGRLTGMLLPGASGEASVVAAGALVCAFCAWTQRGTGRLMRGPAPVSTIPVALFAAADMLILASGLSLLPHPSTGA